MADARQANSAPGRSGSSALHKSLNLLLKAAEILLGRDPAALSGTRSAPQLGRNHNEEAKVRSEEGGALRKEGKARNSEGKAKGTAGQETRAH